MRFLRSPHVPDSLKRMRALHVCSLVTAAVLVWAVSCEANAEQAGLLPMDEVEELTPDLAIKYSNAEQASLVFPRVKKVDPQTAAVLAKHKTGVKLPGLAVIDPSTAQELAKTQVELGLDGIGKLDQDTAGILATSSALLSLEGIDKLDSLPLAQKLSRQIGMLFFPRITEVDQNIADALSNGPITLSMPRLRKLTHLGLAAKIARAASDVNLPALEEINADAAEGLCAGVCKVYLPSLIKLEGGVAKAFSQHEGVLQLHGVQTATPPEIALLLTNNGPLSIGGIKAFAQPGQPVDARILQAISLHAWPLDIGLDDIPPDLAAAIKKRKASINLVGVKWLSRALAQSLVGCQGMVWMTNVKDFEAGAVDDLLKHRNAGRKNSGFVLSVDAMGQLNADELERLEKHESIHFGNNVQVGKYRP